MRSIVLIAVGLAVAAAQPLAAYRMRVEYLENPLTVDVVTPRFSWALAHTARASVQSAYHLIVKTAAGAVAWDTGVVTSNVSLNVPYGGAPLISDTDYTWTLTWTDGTGATAPPASATFSTGLLSPSDWHGAAYISSTTNGSLNTYRTEFTLAALPVRARMFIIGLGYAKTWLNGALTDDHELGQFVTFEQRVLYDVVDVTSQLVPGCNALGVMVGSGWFAQKSVKAGPRQFRLLLSLTAADGSVSYMSSSLAPGAGALTFTATVGPVTSDDMYDGETFDGRNLAAISGWTSCGFVPAPGAWQPAAAPDVSPATFGALVGSHTQWVRTDRTYSPVTITQPLPGVFVFDMSQNIAGQTTLRVTDCPAGTNITLIHNEILNPDGTVNRNLAKMQATYICAGTGAEEYRTLFVYYGFRYVQVEGYPGVPGEEAVASHFVHSDFPQAGEFSSSNGVLNAVQHATRFASWSNLVDIPTDCPQRERRGWLGDAQLSFETVIHNIDGGAFYTKWLRDFVDTQVYDNATMGTDGALPDCIPFYGHGHPSADAGWGIAAWVIPDWFSDYYADDVFDVQWYPHLVWYMENWVAIANKNKGLFNLFFWGDWANYLPGPYAFKTPEYPQYFYIRALEITAKFATRLGHASDAARYTNLATAARSLYLSTYYHADTACMANCTYVSQIFALDLGLIPEADIDRAWAHCMDWFGPNATQPQGLPDHFGGGIISLKYLYPQLTKRGLTGLGLRMHLQSDRPPGFGYWIANNATTLWEAYDMTSTVGGASRNHIMFGASGSWYYKQLAGLDRAPASRSWQQLVIAPPGDADTLSQLQYASAAIDTTMGLATVSWDVSGGAYPGAFCGEAPEKGSITATCVGGTFDDVVYASYGTPLGSCAAGFTTNASCTAVHSYDVVAAACLNKASCTLPATTAAFGNQDPCFDVVKRLAVVLKGKTCKSVAYSLASTVPVGSTATVAVPTLGAAASSTITEGAATVWTGGAFVPGTPGVTAGAAGADGTSVVFAVGSGSYNFVVTAV